MNLAVKKVSELQGQLAILFSKKSINLANAASLSTSRASIQLMGIQPIVNVASLPKGRTSKPSCRNPTNNNK